MHMNEHASVTRLASTRRASVMANFVHKINPITLYKVCQTWRGDSFEIPR